MRLLVSFVGGEGHLRPLLPVAAAAAAAGHDVLIAGAAALAGVVAAAGLAFAPAGPDVVAQRVPLQPLDLEREDRVLREDFADRRARRRAAALLELVGAWRPDVVLRDEVDLGAVVAAERSAIPHASVLVIAGGGFVRPELVAPPLDRLRAEHGLAADPDLRALGRHLVLSPFPPSFRDPADPLPATARGCRATAAPVTAAPAPRDRPLVYVTLGTIFNTESGDLFTRVLAGLRALPVDVVVTVGRSVDPADLGPQPPTVRVARFIPQAALLPRCAAVVAHGGSGSVLGALAHGLPLLCIPMGADQPRNAARCSALRVGRTLDAVALTPADVRAATTALLDDPTYRRAAAALQAEIAALPPPAAAIPLLERLAALPGRSRRSARA